MEGACPDFNLLEAKIHYIVDNDINDRAQEPCTVIRKTNDFGAKPKWPCTVNRKVLFVSVSQTKFEVSSNFVVLTSFGWVFPILRSFDLPVWRWHWIVSQVFENWRVCAKQRWCRGHIASGVSHTVLITCMYIVLEFASSRRSQGKRFYVSKNLLGYTRVNMRDIWGSASMISYNGWCCIELSLLAAGSDV